MGQGIDLARERAPEHCAIIDDLKDQLLIFFLGKLGGDLHVTVEELDDIHKDMAFSFNATSRTFRFQLCEKEALIQSEPTNQDQP